ncbi:MAG: hypothetical protein WAX79_05850 [Candidatus Omnitrophota bacterium]
MGKLKTLFFSVIIGLAVAGIVFAFTNPTGNPTAGGGTLYYSAGNVGIGTTGPVSKLSVYNSLATALPATSGTTQVATIFSAQGPGNQIFHIGANGVNNGIWFQNNNIGDLSLTYPILLNPNGGNVGIGTTAPNEKLHVSGNIGIPTSADATANGSMIRGVSVWGDKTRIPAAIEFRRDNNNSTGEEGRIVFRTTASPTALAPERMVITGDGNVGIGTTAPGQLLHINGASPRIYVSDTGTSVSAVDMVTNSAAQRTTIGTERAAGGGLFVGSSAYASVFGSAGASVTQFASNNSVRMTIDTTGNVGIGTTAPSSKLDVAGDIEIGSGNAFYLGDPATNGSWKFLKDGNNNIVFQKRIGGVWVSKMSTAASYESSKLGERNLGVSSAGGNTGTVWYYIWSITPEQSNYQLRVRYDWQSTNCTGEDYYSHNYQTQVNGAAVESFSAYQTSWLSRDNTYNITLTAGAANTIRAGVVDTSSNEEDCYYYRYLFFDLIPL